MELPAAPASLVERKRRIARQRIVEAADELFLADGFDQVSVGDIAERAEVGRTTFFRYFGDKAEVVFAREQELLDAVAQTADAVGTGAARTATEAVEQLRPIVLGLCERATSDAEAYARHTRLLEEHLELRSRDALKARQVADRLVEVLTTRGTEAGVAVLAAQVALACYETAKRRASSPAALTDETRAAFEQTLGLGR